VDSNIGKAHIPVQQSPSAKHWGVIVVGICLILIPVMQAFVAAIPWIAIADFVPMDFIIGEVISTLKITHAAFLTGVLMVVSGILLMARHKWGWILGLATIAASLFWAVEGFVVLLFSMFGGEAVREMTLEISLEFLEITYFIPLILVALHIGSLIILGTQRLRASLQIERRQIWLAAGIAGFILVEQHLSLLIFYLQNQ
jgi:membrane-associated HD superfamily phosphohydrolase